MPDDMLPPPRRTEPVPSAYGRAGHGCRRDRRLAPGLADIAPQQRRNRRAGARGGRAEPNAARGICAKQVGNATDRRGGPTAQERDDRRAAFRRRSRRHPCGRAMEPVARNTIDHTPGIAMRTVISLRDSEILLRCVGAVFAPSSSELQLTARRIADDPAELSRRPVRAGYKRNPWGTIATLPPTCKDGVSVLSLRRSRLILPARLHDTAQEVRAALPDERFLGKPALR